MYCWGDLKDPLFRAPPPSGKMKSYSRFHFQRHEHWTSPLFSTYIHTHTHLHICFLKTKMACILYLFLAHLAIRVKHWAFFITLRPASSSLTFTKIFSSETIGPYKTKLGHNHHWGIWFSNSTFFHLTWPKGPSELFSSLGVRCLSSSVRRR